MANNYADLDAYLLSFPEAQKDYKAAWGWDRYLIRGKMFAAICTPSPCYKPHNERTMIILKCDPELAVGLRGAYEDIVPGFYSDKRCYNSVYLDGTVPQDTLWTLCKHSYDLITAKFSKKVQCEIQGSTPIFETSRLRFRRLNNGDLDHICQVLMDPEVMYASETAFSKEEAQAWLSRAIDRYQRDGYSHFAVTLKEDGAFVGIIGLIKDMIDECPQIEVGYLLCKNAWGQGYATEGAKACIDYAFTALHAPRVIARIHPDNTSSIHVAARIGMTSTQNIVPQYKGKSMPHMLYEITH